jgi:hypothetical protein
MFGYCYTQLTDVEQEKNGLYTYERKPKFDVDRLHKIQTRVAAYEKDPPLTEQFKSSTKTCRVLVGANPDGSSARPWRYTLETPCKEWADPGFDDAAWQQGRGGFGAKSGVESRIGTPWKTKDIWLRQQFTYGAPAFKKAVLILQHDDGAEIYLNGKQISKVDGWNDQYAEVDVTQAVKDAIRPGVNTLAIHCHQESGAQFIDAALVVDENAEP